jgi:hypothetical protein
MFFWSPHWIQGGNFENRAALGWLAMASAIQPIVVLRIDPNASPQEFISR